MLTVVGKGVRVVWFVERWMWLGGGKAVGLKRLLRAMLVVVVVMKLLIQNNDSKRKMATSKITTRLTRIIPFKQRWGIYLNTDLAI